MAFLYCFTRLNQRSFFPLTFHCECIVSPPFHVNVVAHVVIATKAEKCRAHSAHTGMFCCWRCHLSNGSFTLVTLCFSKVCAIMIFNSDLNTRLSPSGTVQISLFESDLLIIVIFTTVHTLVCWLCVKYLRVVCSRHIAYITEAYTNIKYWVLHFQFCFVGLVFF